MDSDMLQSIDATPEEAAQLLHGQLARASATLENAGLLASVDGFGHALGLGLQLGPAATEQVLTAILQACRDSLVHGDCESAHGAVPDLSRALSTLGPALVERVTELQVADALPRTAVMEAWATLASELGVLIGQLGLALTIPAEHDAGMVEGARTRAALLDDATGGRFAFAAWLENIVGSTG
jgi:hypothetical protein